MSLLTCNQFLAMPPEQGAIFSAWDERLVQSKLGYTYVNLGRVCEKRHKRPACAANPGELVMTGLQRAPAK